MAGRSTLKDTSQVATSQQILKTRALALQIVLRIRLRGERKISDKNVESGGEQRSEVFLPGRRRWLSGAPRE